MANTATASKMTVSATDVAVEITGMNKWYGDFHVLRDINLKVMKGERIVRRPRSSTIHSMSGQSCSSARSCIDIERKKS